MIKFIIYGNTLEDNLRDAKRYETIRQLIEDLNVTKIEYYGYDERYKQELFVVKAKGGYGVVPLEKRSMIIDAPIGFMWFENDLINKEEII